MIRRAFVLSACLFAVDASAAAGALGTSAALGPSGEVWIAQAEEAAPRTHIVVRRRDAGGAWSEPIRATSAPEPVSADGENRPKIAIGPGGELYLSWTSPTSAQYTADIRFTRSLDGGGAWSAPATVHHDRQAIGHRFEALLVKLSDQSCECCRIALARDGRNRPLAMWRHVYANSERDHAIATLGVRATPKVERATFDRWRTRACPHHGPGLAVDAAGRRHAVWFNQVDGAGRAYYGQLTPTGPARVRSLPAGAVHADVAVAGERVAIAWKRFDGPLTRIETLLSHDGGRTFAMARRWDTRRVSDQPRLVANERDILLVWRKADALVADAL
jgi:hypothetical protein